MIYHMIIHKYIYILYEKVMRGDARVVNIFTYTEKYMCVCVIVFKKIKQRDSMLHKYFTLLYNGNMV